MSDEQIMELFGVVPHFVDERIVPFMREVIPHRDFLVSFYNAYEASINLLDVCGTMHPDYAGMSWRELLSKGRRMPQNIKAFQNNPDYYTGMPARLPSMHYRKINGKTYVSEDGNHRTCIGKFYLYGLENPYVHRVHLVEEEYDECLMTQVFALRKVIPRKAIPDMEISLERVGTRREDGAGWYRDTFDLRVHLSSRKMEFKESFAREDFTDYFTVFMQSL
jgi:hypothetical protein